MSRRSTRILLLTFAISTAPLLGVLSPRIDTIDSCYADAIADAKKLYKQGRKLLKKGEDAEAAKVFLEAYELSQKPEILYFIAVSLENTGDLISASKYYEQYLEEVPEAKNADKVLDKILELGERIKNEYARIDVSSKVAGREVFLNDEVKPRCETPCVIPVEPGKYAVKLTAPDAEPIIKKLDLAAGSKEKVEVEFSFKTVGFLTLSTDIDGASAQIDGDTVELPLTRPLELEVGEYPVVITDGGKRTWEGTIEVEKDKQLDLLVPLSQTGGGDFSLKRIGGYTALSAGIGLLLGGALMGRQASSTFSNLEAQRSANRTIDESTITQGRAQQRNANILFITGGLAAGAGTGLIVWDIMGSGGERAAPSEGAEEPAGEEPAAEDKPPKKSDANVDLLD